jgi:predicted DNA-binding protein
MVKRYLLRLSDEERDRIQGLSRKWTAAVRTVLRLPHP